MIRNAKRLDTLNWVGRVHWPSVKSVALWIKVQVSSVDFETGCHIHVWHLPWTHAGTTPHTANDKLFLNRINFEHYIRLIRSSFTTRFPNSIIFFLCVLLRSSVCCKVFCFNSCENKLIDHTRTCCATYYQDKRALRNCKKRNNNKSREKRQHMNYRTLR